MTNFLHIISVYKGDISWVKDLEGQYILYYKDKPQYDPYNNVNICGAETNILKFIIDFYDNLPDICVFTHPYNIKWTHQGNLYDRVNDIYKKRDNLLLFGSLSFGSLSFGSLSHLVYDIKSNKNVKYDFMKSTNWWNETMQEFFGDMPIDFSLGKTPASQFYVKSDTIRRLPKEFYINMLNFLLKKSIPGTLYNEDNPYNEFWMSRYMEWSWEFIFTSNLLNPY